MLLVVFCLVRCFSRCFFFFFFNDTATTEIYTLSLHDALPIFERRRDGDDDRSGAGIDKPHMQPRQGRRLHLPRSEEHTSELQSQSNLVCRLLLEKKKKKKKRALLPHHDK